MPVIPLGDARTQNVLLALRPGALPVTGARGSLNGGLVTDGWADELETEAWRAALYLDPLHVSKTLPLAEKVHKALISLAAEDRRVDCPELTGCDWRGEPLGGRHEYAHILPLDLDDDGYLDHVLVHAAMGLGPLAMLAIHALKRIRMPAGTPDVRLRLVRQGAEAAMQLDDAADGLLATNGGQRVWNSLTPFVPPRHLKLRGRHRLVGQVLQELGSRGLPEADVTVLASEISSRDFTLKRGYGKQRPPRECGFALQLRFDAPVVGPVTLGYGSHFGLGLFRAAAS